MKKILLTILAIAVLLFPSFVFAAEGYDAGKNFVVSYDGNEFKDNFNGKDFDEVISGMEPGDSVAFRINIENNGAETDWYVSNSVLRSFEDNEKASGGAYSYRLSYIPSQGDKKELYSSDTVGGESTVGGKGLHQVPEDMEDFFFLDTLGEKQKGVVELEVGLDGETQDNSYQNADSSLAMQFAAEGEQEPEENVSPGEPEDKPEDETEDEDEPEDDETYEESKEEGKSKSSKVKTGDENNIMVYAAILIIAGVLLLIAAGRILAGSSKEGSDNEEKK